jgi:hypothetical protein
MYWLVTVGSNVSTLGVRSPLPLGDEERVRWVLRVCLVARSGEIPPVVWFLRTQTGRDLTMADPTSGKRAKDSDIEMGAVGTAGAVASALTALDGFLKAQLQGQGAKQLFRNVRAASAGWWKLVDRQDWGELDRQVAAMLATVIDSGENAGHIDDLQLLDELQQRLGTLHAAVAAAS